MRVAALRLPQEAGRIPLGIGFRLASTPCGNIFDREFSANSHFSAGPSDSILRYSLDGHPALRSTASGGFRSVLAVSSFRFRARLDLSIPSAFSGQRGCEPRFLDMAPLI